jgi:hypothetical protein
VQTPAQYLAERTLQNLAIRGRRLWEQHRVILTDIEKRFGVPPPVLLAIWGRETSYDVRSAADVSRAFEAAVTERVQALQVGVDGTTRPNRRLIVDLAASYKLPTVHGAREFVEDGGLLSYAADYAQL